MPFTFSPFSSYLIRQIFACGRPLLFSLFPFNFKSWCPSLFPSSSSYSICQIFACGGNESNSNMTTLFACAYGVTSLFPSLNMFQEHVCTAVASVTNENSRPNRQPFSLFIHATAVHFNWLPLFFGLRQAHLHYFQRCKTSIEELLFKVLNEKTHLEKIVYDLQNMEAPLPWL